MIRKSISDIAIQVRGVSYKPDDLRNPTDVDAVILLRANNIDDGKINFDDVIYINKLRVSADQYLRKGDILICASSGSKNLVGKAATFNSNIRCTFGAFCKVVRPNSDVADYLGFFFQSNIYRKRIADASIGVNINNIRNEHIDSLSLPIYSKRENELIVRKLSKLSKIIDSQYKIVHLLDNLIKARFVEMFGDPINNPKNFPVYRMNEVVFFQGGSQPPKKYFEYEPTESNVRLIQIRDYKTDDYKTYIPKAMAKRFCNADDIMIGRYGPPIFQILQGIEGSYNVALMKATPKMGRKEYIRYFLKQDCLFHYLEGLSGRTAGQDGIQMDKLNSYPVPMPPEELQINFEALVKQIDKSKAAIQKSIDETQLLYDSLMQKYFG